MASSLNCYRVAENPEDSADVYLKINLTVNYQRCYTFTTRSRTSLLRANNGTFPNEYTAVWKAFETTHLNTEKEKCLNTKKLCNTLIPTVDIWHARR